MSRRFDGYSFPTQSFLWHCSFRVSEIQVSASQQSGSDSIHIDVRGREDTDNTVQRNAWLHQLGYVRCSLSEHAQGVSHAWKLTLFFFLSFVPVIVVLLSSVVLLSHPPARPPAIVSQLCEDALLQNETVDLFQNDFAVFMDEDAATGNRVENGLKVSARVGFISSSSSSFSSSSSSSSSLSLSSLSRPLSLSPQFSIVD